MCCLCIWCYLWHMKKEAKCVHAKKEVYSPTGSVNTYSTLQDLRHLGYLQVGLLSHTCHHFTKLWQRVCLCVGFSPGVTRSGIAPHVTMMSERLLCLSVRMCMHGSLHFLFRQIQGRSLLSLFRKLVPYCTKQSRTEQPDIKHGRWARSCEPPTCKQLPNYPFPAMSWQTHTNLRSAASITAAVINLHYVLSLWSRNTQQQACTHAHRHQLSFVFIRP